MTTSVSIQGVDVVLGGVDILRQVSLDVPSGSFLTLLGPSGSGKTTTLNVVAGFIRPTAGHVLLGNDVVDDVPVHARNLGMVFQNYALFPHLSVGENIAYGLRTHGVKRKEIGQRVDAALELVRLDGMKKRKVQSLSGGQQQRVALARAIVFDPVALLLDEPLSALDRQLREAMQVELKRLQREVGVTTIAVTHDQTEALSMSDTIAILDKGRVVQMGTPEDLYRRPESIFVARFLGEANILESNSGGPATQFCRLAGSGPASAVCVRPEHVGVRELGAEGRLELKATLTSRTYRGSEWRLVGRLEDGADVVAIAASADQDVASLETGKSITFVCQDDAVHVIRRESVR